MTLKNFLTTVLDLNGNMMMNKDVEVHVTGVSMSIKSEMRVDDGKRTSRKNEDKTSDEKKTVVRGDD